MDDRELEGRLRTRLQHRFDDAQVPPELAGNVRQAFITRPRRVGFDLRAGGLRFGWQPVVALAVVVVAVVVAGNLGGTFGPGNRQTPTPVPSVAEERYFIVLPPPGMVLAKPDSSLASDVLAARIRALGFGNFTSGTGYGIEFRLPATGPSDDAIRAVLSATGDVKFVPLPPADYPDGAQPELVGKPLPVDEPALFGWEGIANAAIDDTRQLPAVAVTLKPAAGAAFGDYTTAHPGEYFAIVIDGRVALLPIINEPITGGEVTISGGDSAAPGRPDYSWAISAATLVGGMLPEAWRGASAPTIVSRDQAMAAALAATRGGTVQDASPTVDLGPLAGELRAVWYVDVYQPDCQDLGSCVSSDLLVRVDAITGVVFDVGPQT